MAALAHVTSRAAQQLDGADPASCGLGLSRSILELAGRLISRPLGSREEQLTIGSSSLRRNAMTGAQKFTWGIILEFVGFFSILGGILLSVTVIGACFGIPMIVIGIPLMIWGIIWIFVGRSQRMQETVAAGIQEGLKAAQGRDTAAGPENRSEG